MYAYFSGVFKKGHDAGENIETAKREINLFPFFFFFGCCSHLFGQTFGNNPRFNPLLSGQVTREAAMEKSVRLSATF